jgi:hypothetical protein
VGKTCLPQFGGFVVKHLGPGLAPDRVGIVPVPSLKHEFLSLGGAAQEEEEEEEMFSHKIRVNSQQIYYF